MAGRSRIRGEIRFLAFLESVYHGERDMLATPEGRIYNDGIISLGVCQIDSV